MWIQLGDLKRQYPYRSDILRYVGYECVDPQAFIEKVELVAYEDGRVECRIVLPDLASAPVEALCCELFRSDLPVTLQYWEEEEAEKVGFVLSFSKTDSAHVYRLVDIVGQHNVYFAEISAAFKAHATSFTKAPLPVLPIDVSMFVELFQSISPARIALGSHKPSVITP